MSGILPALLALLIVVAEPDPAEVDLEMKAKALKKCKLEDDQSRVPWREDAGLIAFLRKL